MKYFCKECGTATETTVSIPKFCSECKAPFSSNSSVSTPKPSSWKPRYTPKEEDIEIEEPTELRIPQNVEDAIEIVGEEVSGVKFSSIAQQAPTGMNRPAQKLPKGKKSRKDLITKYMAETKAKDLNNVEVLGTPGED